MKRRFINIFLLIMAFSLSLLFTSCNKISEITGVNYDSEQQVLSWDKINRVETYNLTLNGVQKLVGSSDTQYKLSEGEIQSGKNISVDIEGVSSSGKVVNKTSTEIVVLPSMDVVIKDGKFDWTESSSLLDAYSGDGNVIKYKAVLNNKELPNLLTETTYTIPEGSNEFKVKPVLENSTLYYSNYKEATANYLCKPTNLNYDSGLLTWGDVDFYSTLITYKVVVNDIERTTHVNYISLSDFFDSMNDISYFTAKVMAVGENDDIMSSEYSDEFSCRNLDTVKGLCVQNGILTWNGVSDATKYEIEIDGNSTGFVSNTQYSLEGNLSSSIRVRAISDATKTVSSYSRIVTVNVLASPMPTFSDKRIVWNDVGNADYYKIKLVRTSSSGDEEITNSDFERWETSIVDIVNYCDEVGVYKFTVCACSSVENTMNESAYSNELQVVRLGKPYEVKIADSSPSKPNGEILISLSGTNQCAKYEVVVNNTVYGATNENSFTLTKPIKSYSVSTAEGYSAIELRIRTKADVTKAENDKLYLDSKEDVVLELRQINSPENLSIVNENGIDYITWDSIECADSYGVQYGNYFYRSDVNKYPLDNLATGNVLNVSVYAIGENEKWDDSTDGYLVDVKCNRDDTSSICVYMTSDLSTTLRIKKLDSPENIRYISANSELVWDEVLDATGYKIRLEFGSNDYYDYIPEEAEDGKLKTNYASFEPAKIIEALGKKASFYIKIYALGNMSEDLNSTDLHILDSESSSYMSEKNKNSIFEVLDAPKNLTFSEQTITWDSDPYCDSYEISFFVESEEDGSNVGGHIQTVDGNTFAWSEENSKAPGKAGTYRIVVKAVGDDERGYFSSSDSEVLEFTKLATPQVEYFIDIDDNSYFLKLEEGVYKFSVQISNNKAADLIVEKEREKGNIVTVDDEEYLKLELDLESFNNPTIKIQAIGDEKQGYMASNIYKFEQITRQLSAPINPVITSDFNEETKILTIYADIENPFDRGYCFYFNDTMPEVVSEPQTTYKVGNFANLNVKVGFEGNILVEEGGDYIYYTSSESSTASVTIYCLAQVKFSSNLSLNSEGICTVKYNKVTKGQYSYCYSIIDNDTKDVVYTSEKTDIGTVNSFTIDVSSYYYSEKKYICKVYIYSVGTDNNIVSNPDPESKSIALY